MTGHTTKHSQPNRPLNPTLETIAQKHLDFTLCTRNSDSLDFHDIAVWDIKRALEAAYHAGQRDALNTAADEIEEANRAGERLAF